VSLQIAHWGFEVNFNQKQNPLGKQAHRRKVAKIQVSNALIT
jgi:hypothetical protein